MSHLNFTKTRQIGSFFGVFDELLSTPNVNLASLAMLNETFPVIFKHCVAKLCIWFSFIGNVMMI